MGDITTVGVLHPTRQPIMANKNEEKIENLWVCWGSGGRKILGERLKPFSYHLMEALKQNLLSLTAKN